MQDIFNLIIESAADSFTQVTVFVGAVLLLFGFINFFQRGKLVESIEKNKKWQPVIGAFLGLTPGCGGAILIMPLYLKGNITFGTVVATLIATSGDSAFVLISKLPVHYLVLGFLTFIVGIITGYVVDYYKIGSTFSAERMAEKKQKLEEEHKKADHHKQEIICHDIDKCQLHHIRHIAHEEGDEIDLALHHKAQGELDPDSWNYKLIHKGYWMFWLVIFVGLVLGVMQLFQVDINEVFIPNLGIITGTIGTVICIFVTYASKKFLADDTHEETEVKQMSIRETITHNGEETAFVGTWVFAAYLIYALTIYWVGGGNTEQGEQIVQQIMTSAGLISVLVGALIGLIPGCGPQIIFVTLFIKGWVPLAAVFANAISQDGDALFPLLIMDFKSSAWATIITTIPAIIFGLLMYYLETTYVPSFGKFLEVGLRLVDSNIIHFIN
ncbi:MAG: putative manganese transporter [Vulcanimicrobiota bacterium]